MRLAGGGARGNVSLKKRERERERERERALLRLLFSSNEMCLFVRDFEFLSYLRD